MIIALILLCVVILVVGMVFFSVIFRLTPPTKETREVLDKVEDVANMDSLRAGNYLVAGEVASKRKFQEYIFTEEIRKYNILNVGPIGKGKSRLMMEYFRQDLQKQDNAIVIYDPQRDLTSELVSLCKVYGRKYTLFPDAGFNPLAGSGTADNRARLFADLYGQISRSGQEGGGIFFSELVQTFILLVVPLFEAAYKKPMTLQELLLVTENKAFRDRLFNDAPPGYEKASYDSAIGGSLSNGRTKPGSWTEKDFKENLTGIPIFIRRIYSGDDGLINLLNRRNAPTFEQCIERKEVVIIRAGGYPSTLRAIVGLMFQLSLQAYIERRDTSKSRHLLAVYIDELPMFLNINFKTLVSTSRKQLVALFMGFQQIKQLYPYEDVITGNVLTWLIHNGLGAEETKYIAETIGQREYMVNSTSVPADIQHGVTVNKTPQFDYALSPTVIRNIPQEQVLMQSVKPHRTREVDDPRYLVKPSLNTLNQAIAEGGYVYASPIVTPNASKAGEILSYPPPHIWA